MDMVSQFIEPEFAILVAILYCIGGIVKRTQVVPCRFIPLLLAVCGVMLAALSILAGSKATANLAGMIYHAIGQGVLCAAVSVYLNQLIKQTGRK